MEQINSITEGADTLITTHFRQGQLPWQGRSAWRNRTKFDPKTVLISPSGSNDSYFQMLPTDFTKQDAIEQAKVLGVSVRMTFPK